MRLAIILLLVFTMIAAATCKRDSGGNEPVTTHCLDLINETLDPSDDARVHVATGFTPNGDGINDLFHPLPVNVASITVKIYGDDSQVIYMSSTIGGAWNPGVINTNKKYYYRVEAVTLQGKKIGFCGEVWALKCLPNSLSTSITFEDQATPYGFTGVTSEVLNVCN